MITLLTFLSFIAIIFGIRTIVFLKGKSRIKTLERRLDGSKTKSCFWGHDWGQWKQSYEQWKHIERSNGREYGYTKTIQQRYCKRCNKLEQESID